jgi:hypothetical protein
MGGVLAKITPQWNVRVFNILCPPLGRVLITLRDRFHIHFLVVKQKCLNQELKKTMNLELLGAEVLFLLHNQDGPLSPKQLWVR